MVDPRNPDVALAGALGNPFVDSQARGVYRTTDGGKTWRQTLYVGPRSGTSDLAWDPHDPRIVYAGIWEFRRKPWTFTSGGPRDGVYKSSDGGVTWRLLEGNGLPSGVMGRIGVAVAPSDARRVYALIQSKQGLLWRSDDGGARWRMMSADTLIDQRPFYMSRLVVDPTDRDRVFFASENLIETRNGGRTFRDISDAVHQDHHDFWISRDGRRIIEADDGGAPISIDGGKTWDWRFNVDIAQIYHLGYDEQNPYRICAALQDNDSFCGPSLSLSPLGITERDWRDVANNSDGIVAWPERGNPSQIWNVGINELNGQLGIFDLDSRQNYDVTPYVRDTNGRPLAGLPYRFNWEAPLALSGTTGYFGANVVFATSDHGRTWTAISPDLTRNDPSKQQVAGGPINTDVSGAEFYDTLLAIAPSPIDVKTIWAGSDDGLIWRTTDAGAHWQNVTPARIAPWGRIEMVEPSRASSSRAYAVVNRHAMGDRAPYLLVTDDGGASWRSIAADLPRDEPAHVVREDPKDPDVLYAGLEQGVWLTLDRGAHWQRLRLAMPPVAIRDLLVQPSANDLVAGTHGRGIYVLDDLAPIQGFARARASAQPALFDPRPAYTWYVWWATAYGTHDDGCCVPAGVFSGGDPPYGALISYYLPQRTRPAPWIEILDERGKHVRRIEATGDPGVNRVAWDLLEDPVVAWSRARDWNKTWPAPMVVPGRYTAVLHENGKALERSLDVRPDPRGRWTQEQYAARHDFLASLDGKLAAIDAALNELDAMRSHVSATRRSALDRVYAQLTSGIVNSEDDQWRPDRIRERLTILLGVVDLSQGPPLPPHLREAAEIQDEFDRAMTAYHSLLQELKR